MMILNFMFSAILNKLKIDVINYYLEYNINFLKKGDS